jgi:rhamnosyl/mannosyltransferase
MTSAIHFRPATSADETGADVRSLLSAAGTGRLRVLVVTSEAPPIVSGISRCVQRLTAGLRGRGHQVDVLSSVQIPRLCLGEWRFSALLAYWLRVSRMLDGYDVVNLHGPVPTMSDVFLMLAGARKRMPVVYTHHSALAIRGMQWACRAYNRLHRVLSGRADLILTTSEHYAALERRADGPEVRVVPWGVDVRPQPLKARPGTGPLRVLFVGQMRGYKGVEYLVPAVAGQDELELRLVGDGPNRADYEQLAAGTGNVTFLGRVSDPDLHAEYDRADVVVLPSVTRAEAFGLVTLEGMAAACVPVVSDIPGVRDVAAGAGLVVPPKDVDGLRAALLGLARDADERVRLSRLARAKAGSLSWDSCVERYEDALLDAVAARADRVAASAPAVSVLPVAA